MANLGCRYVRVYRADLNETGQCVRISSVHRAMPGGIAAAWGSLLTGSAGNPTLLSDYIDFRASQEIAEVEY